ncbi:enoyl-CoA hydratase [Caballeronia udeis]|uniref:Enoyl-CoA hydratase n=1 Tax=Caballeronia udeis TaxID=1232866 RepID=A0A158GR04_9BURK|nr:2-(1,2-epoxy-1,2-dihydrophenyl)acetyl-CoA isomerase PaaG [Caballeronia udeis]SAL34518.1 enoyl-CoA hydratase [Caballeronia udeis]
MTYKTILFESCRGIARLTLNRPDRLNAFTAQMHEEVADALSEVEANPAARVLLLTASGRGFCAGQDLTERDVHAGPLDLGKTTRTYYNPLIRRLTTLPLPVVCAVNGVAAGAGVNLALACDLVIACSSARFVQAFSGIGLVPDAGGTWALPHLIGQARALGFTLTGGTLSASTAAQWGLIWKAVDDEHFEAEREALLEQLACGPTRGLGAAKLAIRSAARATLDEQLDLESELQRQCGLTNDYKEGVSAFKERRRPDFTGS